MSHRLECIAARLYAAAVLAHIHFNIGADCDAGLGGCSVEVTHICDVVDEDINIGIEFRNLLLVSEIKE